MMTKTTTTLLISLLLVACGKSSKQPEDKRSETGLSQGRARDVAVGESHVCAVLSTGQVTCWGDLRGVSNPLTTKPVIIPGIADATAISEVDCVLRGDKPAMCWDADSGVTEVPGTEGAKKIVSRGWDPCFLLTTGSVSCWNRREKTVTAMSGLPKLRSISRQAFAYDEWCYVTETGEVGCSGADIDDVHKALPRYPDAVDIVRTEQDTLCVLRQGGMMNCVGQTQASAIKYPTRADEIADRCVRVGDSVSCAAWSEAMSTWTWAPKHLDGKPTKLSCEAKTCCVITGGEVACWGDNSNGRLADRMESVAKPTKVGGLPPVSQVFAGDRLTMAITKEGDLYAWGSSHKPSAPTKIGSAQMLALTMDGAVAVTGRSARFYSAGQQGWDSESLPSLPADVVAITSDGSDNPCAALVDGTFHCLREDEDETFHWDSIAGMKALVQLSTTGLSVCGTTKLGVVACMNDDSESGDRPPTHGSLVRNITKARRIDGKFVELSDGNVFSFGIDEDGKWTPAPRPELAGMTMFALGQLGWAAACGLKDKRAYCWFEVDSRDDPLGMLARSSNVSTDKPAPVEGLPDVRAISIGNSHVCAIDTADAVWCWGEDKYGELGRGRVTFRDEAKRVAF